MAAEIPLKIRVDIRDLWDAKSSSVQEAVNSLSKTLGYTIVPRVEWPAMWGELKDRFPDKTAFVPTIARITTSWYNILLGRIENDVYSTWTEKLLELLSLSARGNNLTLNIEPSPPRVMRPSTSWRTKTTSFYLGIPSAEPALSATPHSAFEKDFDNIFNVSGETGLKEDDGWADVMEETKEVPAPSRPHATSQSTSSHLDQGPPSRERLPTVDLVLRPSDLFSSTAPHMLIVESKGNKLWVQSSNERSLELLASYLKKWGKTNPNDSMKRPLLSIELHDSDFCFGVIDSLTIEPTNAHLNKHVILNPTITLAFIEGVLGYKMVHTNGSQWLYRSDRVLK